MSTYVGFGFNADDLSVNQVVEFIKKHDKNLYASIINEYKQEEISLDILDEYIPALPEYIRDTINDAEKRESGVSFNVVETYGKYVVFDNVRFADDCERSRYIRSAEEFIAMIGKFLDTSTLCFANVYEGSDMTDPCYWQD